jgi:linoleoyl-CoA desaturase
MRQRGKIALGNVLMETDTPLHRELRTLAKDYFARAGLDPAAGCATYAKAGTLLVLLVAAYSAYLASEPTPCSTFALAVASGLAMSGIIFNVHHDGGHGAWSDRRRVNQIMAASFDLLGMSSFLWRWKHNWLHHTYPNVEGLDDDIDVSPFARFAPGQPWRWYHRYQHVYCWLLYPFLTIKWALFDDLREIAGKRIGRHAIGAPQPGDWVLFLGGKSFFVTWMLVVPAAVHGPGVALVFYLLSQFTVGICTTFVFQLAHVVEGVDRVAESRPGEVLKMDWAAHQISSTSDFSRDSYVATWCLGGLNHQVVHHLFPAVSHAHYPALSRVVELVCRRHGIPYSPERRARELLASHYRWLRQMGRSPTTRDAADRDDARP